MIGQDSRRHLLVELPVPLFDAALGQLHVGDDHLLLILEFVLRRVVLALLGHLDELVIEAGGLSPADKLGHLPLLLLTDPLVKVPALVLAEHCLEGSVEDLVRRHMGELAKRGLTLVESAFVRNYLNMLSDRLPGVAR